MRFAIVICLLCASTALAQTVQDSQRSALKKYPQLAIEGSDLNKRFVAAFQERKRTTPEFFKAPDWPMQLADELSRPKIAPTLNPVGPSIDEGSNIAEKLLTKYPKLERNVLSGNVHPKPRGFEVDGSATTYPIAGFILPIADWNALTKAQQVSLSMYVESRVDFIRQHAERYNIAPLSAPSYQQELWAIKHIADDAWYVGTSTEEKGELYLDHKLVQGEGAWHHDYAKEGAKLSEFRK